MEYRPRVRPFATVPLPESASAGGPAYLIQDPNGITEEAFVVPLPTLCLMELADGSRTVEEIIRDFAHLTGALVPEDLLRSLLEDLDSKNLVDNAKTRKLLDSLDPRPARHAGSAYPKDPLILSQFFQEILGPPPDKRNSYPAPVAASILPHIDFFRGRETYTAGYSAIKDKLKVSNDPLTVVILGICHAVSRHPFILTKKAFDTPLGVVPTNSAFVDRLNRDLPFDPFEDEYHHLGEHSVEFHAVALRYLLPGNRDLSIVPVLCGSFHQAIQDQIDPLELPGVGPFLDNLQGLLEEESAIHVLASVDLAHVGEDFGMAPTDEVSLTRLEEEDKKTLAGVQNGDPQAFFSTLQADGGSRNYCGTPAIYTLLQLFPEPFTLHSYQQCSSPDLASSVTVCSASLDGSIRPRARRAKGDKTAGRPRAC